MNKKHIIAKKITVKGKVQGVGFRPFVFRCAIKYNLVGHVINDSRGVEILVQGKKEDIEQFEIELKKNPPPIAEIISITSVHTTLENKLKNFSIKESQSSKSHDVLISPDIATCSDCLRELFDPQDKRYLFPFINCTNCGPRFTITKKIPYDRENTSMSCFVMCNECLMEYTDPLNRRFHAQPNCCPKCGPRVYLLSNEGKVVSECTYAIEYAAREIVEGNIIALKGLGGYHICCAADETKTITRLRRIKNRPFKPFALMAQCIEDIKDIVEISHEEKAILQGRLRPIVLLKEKQKILPKEIAPDSNYIGIMLPYTPLHHILFYFYKKYLPENRLPILIMTSGNKASQPIAIKNREAIKNLSEFVSYFLIHNRDILIRCDDSVVKVLQNKRLMFFRRARGFVPSPVFVKQKLPCVMGVGAELKNTICIIKHDQAFVSQYIGDLKNLETYNFFLETIAHFKDILKVTPMAIGADMHPDYLSTRYAEEQKKLPVIRVQHHHAHILSVMAENKIHEDIIGIALDGSGLGLDNTIWGGEILIVKKDLSFQRVGHLYPIKLPGREIAIKEIWRIALSFLFEAKITNIDEFLPSVPFKKKELVFDMLKKDINCITTTSCGRLFDAISSLIGVKNIVTYEGEGAIALEKVQDLMCDKAYDIPIKIKNKIYILDTISLIHQIVKDLVRGESPNIISRKFHLALCNALTEIAKKIARKTGIKKVALSGGVFQNQTIINSLLKQLSSIGLTPIFHKFLSPNDECISLGQAYFAANKLNK